MSSEIVLATCRGRFFGQGMKAWKSMDVDRLKECFHRHGLRCIEATLEEIACRPEIVAGHSVVYSSSQKPGYKQFVEDIAWLMHASGGTLIPSWEMLRAHENKGFQEVLRKTRGLDSLNAMYTTGTRALESWNGGWPAVIKLPAGAKSQSVFLAESPRHLENIVRRLESLPISTKIYSWIKSVLQPSKDVEGWTRHCSPVQPYVLQEYLRDLRRDYKVIVLGQRAFVLERAVRHQDFRASGSGDFSFVDPPDGLLACAQAVCERLGEPCLSLDIASTADGFSLLEFQGTHFGPYTVVRSPFHFRLGARADGIWGRVDERVVLEEVFADAVAMAILSREH